MNLFVCIIFYLSVNLIALGSPALASKDRRIVAIGDLHGDLSNAVEILKLAQIVDDNQHWIGNDTIFIQTGDVLDRGNDTIKLFDLIQNIREEAPLHGGLVIPLLGNHEIMNLKGDWRYVYDGEPDTFGGIKSRKKAFSKEGFIGKYLIPLNITAKVGSTIFCHAGITTKFSQHGINWINDQAHSSIIQYMESRGKKGDKQGLFGSLGPTWYRGYALNDESKACPMLKETLELLEATRMVVGHTVQRDGLIHTRCDGKLVLIDIGISKVYGRHRGALEIRGNDVFAVYPDRTETLPSPPTYKPSSKRNKAINKHIEL